MAKTYWFHGAMGLQHLNASHCRERLITFRFTMPRDSHDVYMCVLRCSVAIEKLHRNIIYRWSIFWLRIIGTAACPSAGCEMNMRGAAENATFITPLLSFPRGLSACECALCAFGG